MILMSSLGKHTRLPFHTSTSQSYFPFHLVHSNISRPLLFIVTPAIIIAGLFLFVINLISYRLCVFVSYVQLFILNSDFHSSLRLKMDDNTSPQPCACFSLPWAPTYVSHVPRRRNKTGKPSASFALLTIVFALS